VTADPEDADRRLFLPSKMNLGRTREGLAYRICTTAIPADRETIWAPYVKWESSPVTVTADEAVAAASGGVEARSAREEATDFLSETLSDGAIAAKEVKRQAEEAGISTASLRRARQSLGVKVEREGGIADKGRWLWTLPKVSKVSKMLTSEVEHLRHLSELDPPESPYSGDLADECPLEPHGDPFASLKTELPDLPAFLNRRVAHDGVG
jgi:putative DNA primase/helicase